MSSKVERFINFIVEDMVSQTEGYKDKFGNIDYIGFNFIPFGGEPLAFIKDFYSKYNLYECYNKIYNNRFFITLKNKRPEVYNKNSQSTIILSISAFKKYLMSTYGLSESDRDIINSIWTNFFARLMEMYGDEGESLTEGFGGEIRKDKKVFYRDYIIQRIISNTEWDLFSNEIYFPFEFNYSLGHFLIHPESVDEGPYHAFTTYVMGEYGVTEDFATDVYLEFKTEMVDQIKDNTAGNFERVDY
jgi:hypothetical protein